MTIFCSNNLQLHNYINGILVNMEIQYYLINSMLINIVEISHQVKSIKSNMPLIWVGKPQPSIKLNWLIR